jgi:hypothetical protein
MDFIRFCESIVCFKEKVKKYCLWFVSKQLINFFPFFFDRKLPNGIDLSTSKTHFLRSVDSTSQLDEPFQKNYRIVFSPPNKTSSPTGKEEHEEDNQMDNEMETILFEFPPSPVTDVFQFGRMANSTNDFIIPGHLHMGEDGVFTSAVSRWSFRIVCERLPPYRSFIFAGGFNDAQVGLISFQL